MSDPAAMTTQLFDLPERYVALTDLEDDDFETQLDGHMGEYTTSMLREVIEDDLLKLGRVVKTLEAKQAVLSAFANATLTRADAVMGRIARLKAYMLYVATQAGVERVKDDLVNVYTQANPPSVEIVDEAAVPMKYKRTTVSMPYAQALELLPEDVLATARVDVMKQAILQDIKDTGEVVNGVTAINDRRHLRVK